MVMGYSTTTPVNSKIVRTNSISQHTSVIAEYSASVTNSVTVFSLCDIQAKTGPLIRTIYPPTLFRVSLSPE